MNTKIYVKRFDTGATADLSEDFTLPDYQPEMSRVIAVRATATVDGKYLSGDELEADGGVTYSVLYTDGNGNIAEASETSQYTGHIPLKTEDDLYGTGDIVFYASAENVNCRVTAPRRFTLSSRVRMSALSQKGTDCGVKVGGEDTGTLRRKSELHRTACLSEVRKSTEVSGYIQDKNGIRIVSAHGDIALTDAHADQTAKRDATVKGDAYVTLLLETEDGYCSVRGHTPIEERITLPEGLSGEIRLGVFPTVVMIEASADDGGKIEWRMEYDIDCNIMKCESADITADAYLTSCNTETVSSEFNSFTPAAAVNARLTTNGSMKKEEGRAYITAWGSGSADKCEISDGRLKIGGSAKITVITSGEEETASDEITIPFRYECDAVENAGDCDQAGLVRRILVTVPDITVREDGDVLSVTAELALNGIMLGCERISAVTEVVPVGEEKDGAECGGAVMRIYVPDEDESAWDVSKKFRLPEDARMEGNLYII